MKTNFWLCLIGSALGLAITALPSYADEDGRFRAFPSGGGATASAWVLDTQEGVMYYCTTVNKSDPVCHSARLERLVSPSSGDKNDKKP